MDMCIVFVGIYAYREVLDGKEPHWHVYFVKAISVNSADSLMIQCTHQRGETLFVSDWCSCDIWNLYIQQACA